MTMIEHNLRLSPAERLRQMEAANRFLAEAQARTMSQRARDARDARDAQQLREKLAALRPEWDD